MATYKVVLEVESAEDVEAVKVALERALEEADLKAKVLALAEARR